MSAKLHLLALLSAGLSVLAINPASAQPYPGYIYTDLGPLPSGDDSFATAINSTGQAVGFSSVAGNRHATLWNGTTPTDLSMLPGSGNYSEAWGINNNGMVAGSSWSAADDDTRATVWNSTAATRLDPLSGSDSSFGHAINDHNQVAGWSSTDEGMRATLWNGTTATELGTLGGNSSIAYAINDDGKVAGQSTINSDSSVRHATVWNGTTPTDLGTLGGNSSVAYDINDSGRVAGRSDVTTGSFNYHATIWNGTMPTDLGTLGGDSSQANAINNAGIVVGWSETPDDGTSATLWDGTTAIDLNSFLNEDTVNAGWVLTEAADTNDNGWIVGDAFNNLTNQTHAFLLTPIPEPETYAMFLAGLGLITAFASLSRHRRTT